MTPTTEGNRDDRLELISDLIEIQKRIADALSCAESCETDRDLDANLTDALDAAREFLKAASEGTR